jgi:hypothetical protein
VSDLLIEVATGRPSMAEIRPVLDAALNQQFPGGMLQRRWDGDVLYLSGPGAKGSISLEDGRLVGRAQLGPPASLLKATIEEKIGKAMRQAAG